MESTYILAIDQGTSGTKAVLFDQSGTLAAEATAPLASIYPKPGFVEQNPEAIYQSCLQAVKDCLSQFKGDLKSIQTIGISNQRETFILWDRHGKPLHNAVVWQCKRSVEICSRLESQDLGSDVHDRTGLIIDPYFSGTKLIWLNENSPAVRTAIQKGEACFGTVDAWILYRLTGGKEYATDFTNASRTLLFNIHTLSWDDSLIKAFGLKGIRLPEARHSSFLFGSTDLEGLLPEPVQITGMLGDSHAAAFGEGCIAPGTAKATLGTGSSILMNTGKAVDSQNGMMTTICWSAQDRVDYALEGVIVTCGATIQWMRDQLQLFENSAETEAMALSVADNGGVTLIPAFSGLGAPWWKMDAKAVLTGLTFATTKAHIVRAALESIPFQIRDIIDAMEEDSQNPLTALKADGGITGNHFVMQFIADVLGKKVTNVGISDVSALGAALMAGVGAGIYDSVEAPFIGRSETIDYMPGTEQENRQALHGNWQKMIQQHYA